jgi:di/tricarboxylate transporter
VTLPQIYSIAIIVGIMGLMLWGRLRYDVVAGLGLVAGVAVGIIPAKEMFKGFSDDIVIIVGSALIVSAAIARSGIFEAALRHLQPYLTNTQTQVIALVVTVGVLSAIVKNIGALAMLMPIAFQFARAGNRSPSVFLMPMAFASLLGGIVTLVGTSPNVIVSRVREELTGKPFSMFDFTPVGIFIAVAGIAFLCVGYRLLPRDRRGAGTLGDALDIKNYVTEARVTAKSGLAGKTLSDLLSRAQAGVRLAAILRDGKAITPLPDSRLRENDIVILTGAQAALDRLVKETDLALESDDRPTESEDPSDEVQSIEVVIGPNSTLIGRGARLVELHASHGINLLAVGRAGETLRQRVRDIELRMGDVLVVQGPASILPQRLGGLGLLPLAERTITLGDRRPGWVALAILGATIAALAFNLLPVPVAFFCAAGAMILFGALPVREAYAAVEWPILIMFAALIPISDALSNTKATQLIADGLSHVGAMMPAWGALAMLLAAAMAVTPFLNNAATVLVMAPIGATFAKNLGYNPDPFLMAVAIGAACDFLTPIGHQCNTLVMGPGGYRFGDYARLGAPLSLLVLVMAVPLLMIFWPLR